MLETERKVFAEKIGEMVAQHLGKFVLIKGEDVIGIFNTIEEALSEGARQFGRQSFLVRQITTKTEADINIPALTLGILRANTTHTV